MVVIVNVAPCKTKRVKENTQNWFDGEVLEKLSSRDKLFKAFKKTRHHINKELYKKAKYDAKKLIAAKKQAFFDEKLSESVDKPKELWNTLKYLGMPKSLTYDIKTISKVFKDFFSNLVESFLIKLPHPSNKYNLESVFLHYSNFAFPKVLHLKYFSSTSEEKVFKILENVEISEAAGISKLPGRFLKDGAEILSKPINEI